MTGFSYEATEGAPSPLHSQLGNLFLTHDSLVLMTLQHRIQGYASQSIGPDIPLFRAEERKRLLFWHIYGVDAFHTIQRKLPSRIRDYHAGTAEPLPGHAEKTYLDAMLSLAIIARSIHKTFMHPTAMDTSTLNDGVNKLYEQLAVWNRTLPSYLRNFKEEGSNSLAQQGGKKASMMQKAVLVVLEHNSYMQIESYISESGTGKLTSLQAVVLCALGR